MTNKEINIEKYENAILYFIQNCNGVTLGKTKLNKLLYYLDFVFYRDNKKTITRDFYIREQFGPIPSDVNSVLNKMREKDIIKIDNTINKKGNLSYKFTTYKKADETAFEKKEFDLLKKISIPFKNTLTAELVAQTHLEAPWFYSKPLEIIDFKYAGDIEII